MSIIDHHLPFCFSISQDLASMDKVCWNLEMSKTSSSSSAASQLAMGCAASQLDTNQDVVRRCRERRRLLKAAIPARRHLAAAHADYLRSLRGVGSALSRFAAGEPLAVSDHTPPVTLCIPGRDDALLQPPSLRHGIRAHQEQANGGGAGDGQEEVRTTVSHRSLAEMAVALEEYFVYAAEAGEAVSTLLLVDVNSSGHHYGNGRHLSNWLSALCWKPRPSRGTTEQGGSRWSTAHGPADLLEQLVGLEKRLSGELKVREKIKMEHERVFGVLQSQEYSRKEGVDLHQVKAAADRLQSMLSAAAAAADATIAAIVGIRDSEFADEIAHLIDGLWSMWRLMHRWHDIQSRMAQQLRGLVSRPSSEQTTRTHHRSTQGLAAALSDWDAAFVRLSKHENNYVAAVQGWVKLTTADMPSSAAAELAVFLDGCVRGLGQLPYAPVSKATRKLAAAVDAAHARQYEEMKCGRRVEQLSKEVERRSRSLQLLERDYLNANAAYSSGMVDMRYRRQLERDLHAMEDARQQIAELEKRLEEESRRHAKAVEAARAAAYEAAHTGLPDALHAMVTFSGALPAALDEAATPTPAAPTSSD